MPRRLPWHGVRVGLRVRTSAILRHARAYLPDFAAARLDARLGVMACLSMRYDDTREPGERARWGGRRLGGDLSVERFYKYKWSRVDMGTQLSAVRYCRRETRDARVLFASRHARSLQ